MSLWSRWVAFLSERQEGTSLAAFRVAIGLVGLYTIGSVVIPGLVTDLWLPAEYGGYRASMSPGFLMEWLGVTPLTVWGMVIGGLVGSVALTLGIGGRFTTFFTLQTVMAATDINSHTGGSYDELLSCGLWLLFLADSTRTLSLDCRLRTGKWTDDTPVLAFPRYLMIFQIVLTYWSTGAQKVSAYWTPAGDFSALYYILQQPTWQRWDMSWVAYVFPLTQLATVTTWLFEWLGAPLLLLAFWYRRTRERPGRLRGWMNRLRYRDLFVLMGLMLHIGVFILMEVGPFSWITLTFYTAMFHPDEYAALFRRVRRWREGASAAA